MEKGRGGWKSLRYLALPAGGKFTTVRHYGWRGPDENFARGTGTFRSLCGGFIPAFARCCFCIAASLLVFTSPIRFPFRRPLYHTRTAAANHRIYINAEVVCAGRNVDQEREC